MPVLQAEEKLAAIATTAAGSGVMKEDNRLALIRELSWAANQGKPSEKKRLSSEQAAIAAGLRVIKK